MTKLLAKTTKRFVAVIPGRKTWPVVCHDEPLRCAACMWSIAEFLARDCGHDVDLAVSWSAEKYSAEICGAIEDGAELRRLTVKACFLNRPSYEGFAIGTTIDDLFVADEIMLTTSARTEIGVAA